MVALPLRGVATLMHIVFNKQYAPSLGKQK
jgi:hypothetical protein